MRVVIDATPLLVRSAGVKSYLYHWIGELRRAAGPREIRTFPALEELGRLEHEHSVASRPRTFSGLAALALANHTPLPVMDWCARGADTFHVSTLTRRPPRRTRVTATVHDMTCWLFPELHPEANLRADRSFLEVLRRADRLIAVSESTRADTLRVLALPPERVVVIHSGIAAAFFQTDSASVAAVRARYALKRPFVLSVGTIEPRKNVDTLIEAFGGLPPSVREEYDLVVAGPIGWALPATRRRLAGIRYLGYVPEPDLAPLTAAAAVFAYPSLYEGFGLPVGQAMAAGVPVITSNVSSMPEIAGDAAVLVDPRSVAELRDALARLLLSAGVRSDLGARGRARAERFRWESCAAQSLAFFDAVAGQ